MQVADHDFRQETILPGHAICLNNLGRIDKHLRQSFCLSRQGAHPHMRRNAEAEGFGIDNDRIHGSSSISQEIADNPRLQKRDRSAFVAMMRELNLLAPDHMTEALRTNLSGGKTVDQLLAEAAAKVPFMSLGELRRRVEARENSLVVLDVREAAAFEQGHVPGALHLPRGQLELRVNQDLPNPTSKIVAVCELGKMSTLAAATLRELGYRGATALDGGMKAWREADFPLEQGRPLEQDSPVAAS